MSYCRWSSDNWKCDLYCYEDVRGGYTTHVAGRRRVGVETLPPDPMAMLGVEPPKTEAEMDAWMVAYHAHHAALNLLPFEDIDLPYAGETLHDPTLRDFRLRIVSLQALGYRVPDHVLREIDREIADEEAESHA